MPTITYFTNTNLGLVNAENRKQALLRRFQFPESRKDYRIETIKSNCSDVVYKVIISENKNELGKWIIKTFRNNKILRERWFMNDANLISFLDERA